MMSIRNRLYEALFLFRISRPFSHTKFDIARIIHRFEMDQELLIELIYGDKDGDIN